MQKVLVKTGLWLARAGKKSGALAFIHLEQADRWKTDCGTVAGLMYIQRQPLALHFFVTNAARKEGMESLGFNW